MANYLQTDMPEEISGAYLSGMAAGAGAIIGETVEEIFQRLFATSGFSEKAVADVKLGIENALVERSSQVFVGIAVGRNTPSRSSAH